MDLYLLWNDCTIAWWFWWLVILYFTDSSFSQPLHTHTIAISRAVFKGGGGICPPLYYSHPPPLCISEIFKIYIFLKTFLSCPHIPFACIHFSPPLSLPLLAIPASSKICFLMENDTVLNEQSLEALQHVHH